MISDGKITIKEVAHLANTSKTTVSFYLNGKTGKMSEETRQRIEKVIKETNYKPSIVARSLNSKLLGILIGDITNTFSNQIVKGIEEVASKSGYQLILGTSNYNHAREENYIERMLSLGVDGFIVQPTAQFRKISKKVEKTGKSMVFFDSSLYDYKTKWVKTNNYDATYEATIDCIKKGYKKFILITADPSLLSTRIERVSGYIDALAAYDLVCEKLIVEDDKTDPKKITDFLADHVNVKEKELIFVPNCWALPMVFIALKDYYNLMPNLGLVGFDNTEWTNFASPSITTIVQPAFQEGKRAATILIDQIECRNEENGQQVLDCSINWNESTL